MSTSPFSPDRAAFRATLAQLAAKTQSKLPQLNGRVEKACKLVLQGDVDLRPGDKALVHSLSDPSKTYTLEPGHCTCPDFPRAPDFLCAHRLAAGFQRKLSELLPTPEPVPALPEASASANCRIVVAGVDVQITLRDTSEQRLLQRLEELL